MKNGLIVLAVGVSFAGFAGMMRVKTDVQQLARQRQALAEQQLGLREQKRVLEAEYALLASPMRLEALARQRGFVDMGILQMVAMQTDASVTAPVEPPSNVTADADEGVNAAAALLAAQGISDSLDVGPPAATSDTGVIAGGVVHDADAAPGGEEVIHE